MKDFSEKNLAMDCNLNNAQTNCLPAWAPVLTPDGYKFFADIQNKIHIHGKDIECSNIIKKNDDVGVYEVKLECGIPAYMTLTQKIAVQNGDKNLEELKPGDIVNVHFMDISKTTELNRMESLNGYSSWNDFHNDYDVLLNSLKYSASYQAGVIIGSVCKTYEVINNMLCITKTFKTPALQLLQILMSQFGIYSHLDTDGKLIIITINPLEILFKKLEYDEMFKSLNLTNINTPSFYTSKLMEQQKITDISFHSNNIVYDIEVPKTNHFVTSSIIVHA